MKQLLIILLMLALLAGCATQADAKDAKSPNVKVEDLEGMFFTRITDYDNGVVCYANNSGAGAAIFCVDRPLPAR